MRVKRRRTVTGSVTAACIGLLLAAAAPAWADTETFLPAADSYVSSDQPDANFGTAARLRISSANPVQRTYLRFDVALPDGAEITGATLGVSTTVSMSTRGFDAYAVASNNWDETGVTYANAPAFGRQLASSGGWISPGYRQLTLPASSVSPGPNSFGLSNESTYYKPFDSRESSNPPRLVVDYSLPAATATPTPEPSATASAGDPSAGASGDPVVAAAGDIACDPASASYKGGAGTDSSCHQQFTSDLMVGRGLAGVLALGDEQYDDGALSAFESSFAPTWGRLKDVMHPVPGNHEYLTADAAGYYDYFDGVGDPSGPAGDRDKGYYSYDIGAWHLLALNSNCAQAGGCGAGSPQEQWAKADLADHTNACTLAYWHHPLFSSGQHGGVNAMQTIWQDLEDAGADLVLSGHDHDYERFAPQTATGVADDGQGIREFVVGTGGKSHYTLATTAAPNSEIRDDDTFGVLMLTLHPTSYDWQFVPEAGKTFTDSGSAACH